MRSIALPLLLLSLSACTGGRRTICCHPPAGTATAEIPVNGTAVLVEPTVVASPAAAPALDSEDPAVLWAALLEGNARYRTGRALHPHQDAARRAAIATKQTPRVVVLSCADSRVAPEVLFDTGMGDLFVVRVAGNVSTPEVDASIEYAVEHLGARLIVVMGHERCGAVAAAIAGGQAPGHLPALLARIRPAVAATAHAYGEPVDDTDFAIHVVAANARLTAESLAANEILKEAAHTHRVGVRAAVFDLDTGEVTAVPLTTDAAAPAASH